MDTIRSQRGTQLEAKSWLTEAALWRTSPEDNLDPEVAERPQDLVVYGGIGGARNWGCYEQIVTELKNLRDDQTLLIQSGKPVGVFQTHVDAPRVLLANSNLVPHWATWEHFNELDRQGLMMYRQDDRRLLDLYREVRASSRAPTRHSWKWGDSITAAICEADGFSPPDWGGWAVLSHWPPRWRVPRCWQSNASRTAYKSASTPAIWMSCQGPG